MTTLHAGITRPGRLDAVPVLCRAWEDSIMRDAKDRTANWMITQHGDSLLRLGKLTGFLSWRAAQARLTHPQQLPDGLLDVTFPDRSEPVPVLIEVETYPDRETTDQVVRDLAAVLLDRRVLPDLITLVLHPKGQYRLTGEQVQRSPLGLTEQTTKWQVIELWTIPAGELLALEDVGLVPWALLARYDGPPEALFQTCRERIDRQAGRRSVSISWQWPRSWPSCGIMIGVY